MAEPPARRAVEAHDPSLSDQANELLSGELRAAAGHDAIDVARDAPDVSGDRRDGRSGLAGALRTDVAPLRLFAVILGFMLTAVACVVVAFALDQAWAAVLAVAVVAAGGVTVMFTTTSLASQVEHPDPGAAAVLEEQGVADPDRVLNERLSALAGEREAHDAPEVISGGHNRRTASSTDDPLDAFLEQRTATTPTSGPSAPTHDAGGAVPQLPRFLVGGGVVVLLAAAIIDGGLLWLAFGLMVVLAAGYVALERVVPSGAEEAAGVDGFSRAPGDRRAALVRRALPTLLVLATVLVLVAIIGVIAA